MGWTADDSHYVKIPEKVEGKKATRMIVTREPPSHFSVDGTYPFAGYLEDVDGNRLAGKQVILHLEWDGATDEHPQQTDSSGNWSWGILPYGEVSSISVYAYFAGDAYYEGSKTKTYTTIIS